MSIDGELNNWIYWEHTKAKHQILRNYLGRWLAILGQWHPQLFICDGFAGRGEYQDGSEGSPVIILRTANALMTGGKVGQVICAFIEKNEENFSNLSKVLQKAKLDYPAVKVLGPYESALETAAVPLLKAVKGKSIPSFFFLDPFGFSGISFAMVADIMKLSRSEVFITFMLRDIQRFLSSAHREATMDTLLGTPQWRKVTDEAGAPGERERRLRDLYMQQLTNLGSFVSPFRVTMDEKLQTLYYMIHATNSPKGRIEMKEVMKKQGAGSLFAFLGPSDYAARVQMPLFSDDRPALKNL